MRPEVEAALGRSAQAFRDGVWPVIAEACGGGELVPVETVTAAPFAKELDALAGVDAWQVSRPHGMRAIASRVQWCSVPYNTFTIRAELRSGYATELQKRWHAIRNGYLYPHITTQAYVDGITGAVHSVAVAHTRELFTVAAAWVQTYGQCADPWRQRDGIWMKEAPGGNRFLVVDWAMYRARGHYLWAYEGMPSSWGVT